MAYLNFNKEKLVNLEYSLKREILATNRAGGYLSTTIVCCNTRKYHGLFVVPVEKFDGEKHVLLSSLDETIIQHGQSFNLGIHKYEGGVYEPKGHKYCREVSYEPVYAITYRVGGVVIMKEIILSHTEPQLLIRYTLLEAQSQTTLCLKPFLAFRNINALSQANMDINTKYEETDNGIISNLYKGFPDLHMQLSKKNEFVATPDWYNKVEYTEEQERGYAFQEDLYVPGYFEVDIKKGEPIIFSASLEPAAVSRLKQKFEKLRSERAPRNSFVNCMKYSAGQFIVKKGKNTEVVAGYPWFGAWGRDTFISLPGLTLTSGDTKTCKAVLDTMCKYLKGGLFPNICGDSIATSTYTSVDASLWFFKALQEYGKAVGDDVVWKQYKKQMKQILECYREGISHFTYVNANGLIWSKQDGKALTWMDAVCDGKPVTQRGGFAVEVNALWYNAICYTLRLAKEGKDSIFVKAWRDMPALIEKSYVSTFWNESEGYLADYVDDCGQNLEIRPNQLFACSLEYSPIDDDMKNSVLDVVTRMLLTSKGIRTLSPRDAAYKGMYSGDQTQRDQAYHQGSVWPWLLGAYVEGCFRIYGKSFVRKAGYILEQFEENMTNYGVCSIAEVFDGNPPHFPSGAISQAWSVGELLRVNSIIESYEK